MLRFLVKFDTAAITERNEDRLISDKNALKALEIWNWKFQLLFKLLFQICSIVLPRELFLSTAVGLKLNFYLKSEYLG